MKSLCILFSVIIIVAFSCRVCSAEKKGSSVEGLVVDAQDKPLDGIKILATQQKPLKGYEKFEVKTKSDGTFVIKGLYPESKYIITPVTNNYNKRVTTIEIVSGPSGETKLMQYRMVLKFSPFNKSNNGVITDTRYGLEWMRGPKPMNYAQANEFATTFAIAGGGWRLPTITELHSLYNVEYKEDSGCSIDPLFNLDPCDKVWSSELWDSIHPWSFSFYLGLQDGYNNPYDNYPVLVVRSRK